MSHEFILFWGWFFAAWAGMYWRQERHTRKRVVTEVVIERSRNVFDLQLMREAESMALQEVREYWQSFGVSA